MKFGLLEILGLFLTVAGAGTIVGAAYLISLALAVLVAGVFLLFGGVVVVYVASSLEAAAKASAPKAVS